MKSRVVSSPLTTKQIKKMVDEEMSVAIKNEEADLMALVLYVLNEEFGFGKTRLLKFATKYHNCIDELADWYCLENKDKPYLARHKMEELGINIDELVKENGV